MVARRQRAPAPWLSAAVSAGYLPCLERFTRTMASPACTYPASLDDRAAAVLELMKGQGLMLLVLHGEEREAAALVATAVKATAALAGGDVCKETALERFVDIPGAFMEAAFETAEGSVSAAAAGAGPREGAPAADPVHGAMAAVVRGAAIPGAGGNRGGGGACFAVPFRPPHGAPGGAGAGRGGGEGGRAGGGELGPAAGGVRRHCGGGGWAGAGGGGRRAG